LKRKLLSMESKKKARENKEREQEVIREHRKKEKEAIAQGKNPFYLKKSEQKKQALVNKFDSMKSKDRERLIERRRKKISQKEKKNMPAPRRIISPRPMCGSAPKEKVEQVMNMNYCLSGNADDGALFNRVFDVYQHLESIRP
ncbi:hypothetical protein KCU90_g21220, partial [Aureobasidium melanogenum]